MTFESIDPELNLNLIEKPAKKPPQTDIKPTICSCKTIKSPAFLLHYTDKNLAHTNDHER